jgi:hypothetical protein
MTIASKSGGLILKGGALATNCNCCAEGGWYCCLPLVNCLSAELKLRVVLDIDEQSYSLFLGNTLCRGSLGGPDVNGRTICTNYKTAVPSFSGTYILSNPTFSPPSALLFSQVIPGALANGATISASVSSTLMSVFIGNHTQYRWQKRTLSIGPSINCVQETKTLAEMAGQLTPTPLDPTVYCGCCEHEFYGRFNPTNLYAAATFFLSPCFALGQWLTATSIKGFAKGAPTSFGSGDNYTFGQPQTVIEESLGNPVATITVEPFL